MDEVTPAVETLQNYVWRRHTLAVAVAAAAGRRPRRRRPDGERHQDEDGETMGVGFADIVNYTRQSRSLSQKELGHLIDNFEARALEIIVGPRRPDHQDDRRRGAVRGRRRPRTIARIGLELVEERLRDEDFPELRVGLAWGPALARLGDVLGPVVNVASRLTSTSRPGRVLVDRALAEELEGQRALQAAPAAAYVGARLPQARAVVAAPPRRRGPGDQRGRHLPARRHRSCTSRPRASCGGVDEADAGAEGPSGGEGARPAATPAASRVQ